MPNDPAYFVHLAAAFVRGSLRYDTIAAVHTSLWTPPLDTLTGDELHKLNELGLEHGLRLHRFKRTMGLPRVQRVLGALKGMQPSNLLDIGSGRGAFLWPLIDEFPTLPVTALDCLDFRVRDLQAVHDGGVANLTPIGGDVTALEFADESFDGVTMLEVLEHIPNARKALSEVCRVARRFVIVSVPSKPDTNPEHIHLFDASTLTELVLEDGAARVSVDYVPNHLIVVGRMAAV